MDKTVAGVLTAVTAITLGQANAAPIQAPLTMEAAMQARSYADLLKPIPNALALLQAEPAVAGVQKIAFSADQPVDHAHHHHHHHDQQRVVVPIPVPVPPPPPAPHHHHHHHHHNQQMI